MPIIGNIDNVQSNTVQTVDIQTGAVTQDKINGDVKFDATGGGNDRVFILNDKVINSNYTIPVGKNAITAGPITIADGVTVTIPDGSTWVIG